MLYKARNNFNEFFNYNYSIISKAKHEKIQRTKIKILNPKQMLETLPMAFAQVKAGNTSESLVNRSHQTKNSWYQAK